MTSVGVQLTVENHDRDVVALRYVYPVVSRRAKGVSVGINLNVNNACNWACIYCQVPSLTRGGPPPVDLALLEQELQGLLEAIRNGDFLNEHVPAEMRRLADIAFSGNGEPTSAPEFGAAVDLVLALLERQGLTGTLPVRVITNGSLAHRPAVLDAFGRLAKGGGEVWFKVDRATAAGMLAVNVVQDSPERVGERLRRVAEVAPVWLQTCWFGIDGVAPAAEEVAAYLDFVARHAARIKGVHLYGIARASMQPAAARLSRLPLGELQALADRLKTIGVTATVSE